MITVPRTLKIKPKKVSDQESDIQWLHHRQILPGLEPERTQGYGYARIMHVRPNESPEVIYAHSGCQCYAFDWLSLKSVYFALSHSVLRPNLIALDLNEGSPWIRDGATGRRGAVH
jgi:hypothetical protein